MRIVDDIHRIHIESGQPGQYLTVLFTHFCIVQYVALWQGDFRCQLFAGLFVLTAIDGEQQGFGQIGPGTEELHHLAEFHGRHAAGNAIIITIGRTHNLIVFILDSAGLDGNFCRILLKALRQTLGPEHRQIRFRGRAEVLQRMQDTERVLRHQRTAVLSHTTYRFGYPNGVTGKEFIVFRRAQHPHHAQLNDQLIHEFLRLGLSDSAAFQIALNINIKERADTTNGHGCAVLFFNGCQIAKVHPLYSLPGIFRRLADIKAITCRHGL